MLEQGGPALLLSHGPEELGSPGPGAKASGCPRDGCPSHRRRSTCVVSDTWPRGRFIALLPPSWAGALGPAQAELCTQPLL